MQLVAVAYKTEILRYKFIEKSQVPKALECESLRNRNIRRVFIGTFSNRYLVNKNSIKKLTTVTLKGI